MKIKQVIVEIIISLLVLITTKYLVGGFEFSKSTTYVLIFLLLVSFSGWAANRVQIFFLLPKIIPFMILLHSLVLFIVFYLCNEVIGGVSIAKFSPMFVGLFENPKTLQSLGEFGTIGVVAFAMGATNQVINWLNNEK